MEKEKKVVLSENGEKEGMELTTRWNLIVFFLYLLVSLLIPFFMV